MILDSYIWARVRSHNCEEPVKILCTRNLRTTQNIIKIVITRSPFVTTRISSTSPTRAIFTPSRIDLRPKEQVRRPPKCNQCQTNILCLMTTLIIKITQQKWKTQHLFSFFVFPQHWTTSSPENTHNCNSPRGG